MKILGPLYSHPADRVAVMIGQETLTYGRLMRDVDAMARWLRGQGLEPGARLGILIHQGYPTSYWEWIIQLGAIRAGLASSITRGVAPDGEPFTALGQEAFLNHPEEFTRHLPFDPSGSAPLDEQMDIPAGDLPEELEDSAARLFHTSGSTGEPKLVQLDRDSLAFRIEEVWRSGYFGSNAVLFAQLTPRVTGGLRYPLAAWQLGAKVVLCSYGSEASRPALPIERTTFIANSPHMMQGLAKLAPGVWQGRENRTIQLVGGRTPLRLRAELLRRVAARVLVGYGTTETGLIAQGPSALTLRHPGATGFLVDGVDFEVLDEDGQPVPAGEEGRVRVKCSAMACGYSDAPAGDEAGGWKDGWFYPGDMGILFEDGMIALTGRSADSVNVGGVTVALQPIEDALMQQPGVDAVGIVALQLDQQDVVVVAVEGMQELDFDALGKLVGAYLSRGQALSMVRCAAIPRGESGKISRPKLRQAMTEHFARQKSSQLN